MADCAEKIGDTSDNADSVGGKETGETDCVRLCEPCNEEGTEISAAKFCVECQDHLCETCVQHHRKAKPSKSHELIDSGAVGISGVQGCMKREGKDVFNCTIHQEEITHYCEKHEKLCCSKCVNGAHSFCGGLIYNVKCTDKSIEDKLEFKEFVKKLHELTTVFQENKQKAATNTEKGTEHFEKEIERVRKVVDEEKTRVKTIESSCGSVLGDLKKWRDLVEIGQQAKNYEKLFVVMKIASEQLQLYTETLQVLGVENIWQCSSLILRTIQTSRDKVQRPNLRKKFSLTGNPTVRDICPIGQKIAVADGPGKMIYLVDVSNSSEGNTDITLPKTPWEVTVNSSGHMYVCLQGESKIMKYLCPLTDSKKCMEIKTDPNRWCIRCFHDVVKIQGFDPYTLQEVDASGDTRVRHKEDVLTGVYFPLIHSVIDEVTGSMFLIGKSPFGFREVTNKGMVKTMCLSKEIESPGGIVLDSDGSFYISSECDKIIKRVNVDGEVEDFITGLEFKPHGLGLDRQRRLLYVGGLECNVILMYSI